ncbi:3'-5' exonuclease [Acinetobacter brisouii]|uniref:3'-5' exonuclease n=1 Tax=Acinetobacter brisouii TaxID=396323 RepID=UPI00124DB4CE|nr:3'-5' exonuclease [Acinetobacter brisouii]
MIITCLDTETTGLSQEDGDKIIEIALLSYDLGARKLTDRYVQRFNPNRAISAEAQAVHGISLNDLVGCPTWEDEAHEVHRRIQGSQLLVAHNFGFDGPFIAGEIARLGLAVPQVPSFCTMENGRWATFDGKLPKLQELCFCLGVQYDTSAAHAADYDTEVMAECLFRGIDRGVFKLGD